MTAAAPADGPVAAARAAAEPVRSRWAADLSFWCGAFGLGLALLAIERAILVAMFHTTEPWSDVAASFLHGLRFDASGVAYPLLVVVAVCAALGALRRTDGGALRGATVVLALVALAAAVEVPFFRVYRVRLDFIALEYLDDPGEALCLGAATVGQSGVALVVGAAGLATSVCVVLLRRLRARTLERAPAASRPSAVATLALLGALFVVGRGGLGRPLRPQDADRSDRPLVNHLDLSGPFTIERHLYEWTTGGGVTLGSYGVSDAEAAVAATPEATLATRVAADNPRLVEMTEPLDRGRLQGWNVVLVVMESFAARHVGLYGARGDDAWTPCFDDLHRRRLGFPFLNFWSNGPSTNRGTPAIFASFAPVPMRTALSKSTLGQQPFLSLPRVLARDGYDSCFVSGGAEEWENLGGWLRQQGFAHVVGRGDFEEPHRSASFGPPDETILDRMLAECDARAAAGPFLVAGLTSTNHPPFAVPETELGAAATGATERERAMRYADAALGRFVDAAMERPWAARTLFVFVGDHGFHEDPPAEVDPDRYRVPLLLLTKDGGPTAYATFPTTAFCEWTLPACQVDLLPIVVHLVCRPGARYASWGQLPRFLSIDEDRIVVLGPHGGEPIAAALDARGNFLVERLDGGRSRLYHLVGGDVQMQFEGDPERWPGEPEWPNGRLVPHQDPEAEARLRAYLRGYLKAAHRCLVERTAGG